MSIFTNLPVTKMIAQRIEPTTSLMVLTLILSIGLAVPMGVLAAWKHGTWVDRFVMIFAVFGFSVPVFVVGYILAYVFALQLDWFPVQGYTPLSAGIGPWFNNLVLPSVALGGVYIALIARITRATMLEVLSQDYIRTARAKGLSRSATVLHHALRNALNPVVTAVSGWLASLMAGAFFIEYIFNWKGLGTVTLRAVENLDFPVVMGSTLFVAALFVLINIVVDVLYAVLDPRVKLG